MKAFSFSTLGHHAGEIQQAINLELCGSGEFSHLGLYTEGLNGLQANADLPITISLICQYNGIPLGMHDSSPLSYYSDQTYWQSAKELIKYVKLQSFGYPFYDHALYNRYRIEALTLAGQRSSELPRIVGIYQLGQ
jgi:glycosylphosphatidylinositol transamidase